MKKDVLRNFAKFTGKHLRQSLSFNKAAHLMPATLLKKRLWLRCFPMNFAKFLRTPFLQNTSGRLFLLYSIHLYIMENLQRLYLYPMIWTKAILLSVAQMTQLPSQSCDLQNNTLPNVVSNLLKNLNSQCSFNSFFYQLQIILNTISSFTRVSITFWRKKQKKKKIQ